MAIATKHWVTNLLSKMHIGKYSTDEIRVGTWIDGKPIYKLTEEKVPVWSEDKAINTTEYLEITDTGHSQENVASNLFTNAMGNGNNFYDGEADSTAVITFLKQTKVKEIIWHTTSSWGNTFNDTTGYYLDENEESHDFSMTSTNATPTVTFDEDIRMIKLVINLPKGGAAYYMEMTGCVPENEYVDPENISILVNKYYVPNGTTEELSTYRVLEYTKTTD